MKTPWLFIASLAAMSAFTHAHADVITSTYVGPDMGLWNVAGNWSPSGIPSNAANTFNVLIDGGNAANRTVTLASNRTVSGLSVSSGDTLAISNAVTFVLTSDGSGPFVNDGVIRLDSTGGNTYLRPAAGVVEFSGSGDLVMSDSAANWIYRQDGLGSVVNGLNHTIRGAGNLGWSGAATDLTNHGTIMAEGVNLLLVDGSGGAINDGLLQASTGTLRLANGTIDNTNGVIEALAGEVVEMLNIVISGGEFLSTGDGVVRSIGNIAIDGSAQAVTLDANVDIANSRTMRVVGNIENNGVITLNGAAGNTYLRPEGGNTVISGAGEIVMSDSANNWIYRQDAGSSLDFGAGQVIRGAGNIGWSGAATTITNHGVIKAEGAVNLMIVDGSGTFTNNGLLQAATGTLRLANGTIDNSNGVIEALADEIVQVQNVDIAGGQLTSTGTGLVRTVGTTRLIGAGQPMINDAALDIANATTLILEGELQNNGVMTLNSTGGNTYVRPAGPCTLSGSGELVLIGLNSWMYRIDASGALTNGPNHTIRGAGKLGWAGASTPIVNQGTITADDPVNPMEIHAGGMLNSGLIHVTGTAGLAITGANFTNEGTVTIDEDRALQRNNGVYTQTAGTTNVMGTLTCGSGSAVQLLGGNVTGSGLITATVNNISGTLDPGDGVGFMSVGGEYNQFLTGKLRIEIGGTADGQYDRLIVAGGASLGGAIEVVFVNGYVPTVGDSFTIISRLSGNGSFQAINGNGEYGLSYSPTSVTLTITEPCVGDVVYDSTVNVADLLSIISAWGPCTVGCPPQQCFADVNSDCQINVADLLTVISHWGPCP